MGEWQTPSRNAACSAGLDAVDRLIAGIFEAIRTLAISSGVRHFRPDLTTAPLQFWRLRGPLMVYARPTDNVGD